MSHPKVTPGEAPYGPGVRCVKLNPNRIRLKPEGHSENPKKTLSSPKLVK